jgi:serine O-acetyltransferase
VVARLRRAANDEEAAKQAFRRDIRARHPRFLEAVVADARITARFRGERAEFRSPLDTTLQVFRLMLQTDAFFAQAAYRAKARMQALRIPLLPRIAHWIAMSTAQVSIGDPVVVHPGVYIVHGQVVVDGITEVHSGAVLYPWVTVGLVAGQYVGPTIGTRAQIGSGARVLGPVLVGADARVGANAVVLEDVPDGATAVGVPARIVER